MTQDLFSVDQVAEQLGLHVRTVRNYVREGRLKAVRIGKQYRVAREDLAAFTGRDVAPTEGAHREVHVEVTSVVEIDGIAREEVIRLTSLLMSAGRGRDRAAPPFRIETIHDDERARLKVIVLGDLETTAHLLAMLNLRLEAST